MYAFTYHNPVRILFGKGMIAKMAPHIPAGARVLLTYGGGSIKTNGVYEQVSAALKERSVLEFGGIEPNPRYETLMQAVELARREKIDFLLAVGGGSVLDGSKFISAAVPYRHADPWELLSKHAKIKTAIPLAAVLTLPATGSEMNSVAVISRESTRQKLAFGSPLLFPLFSVLDPETTLSLSPRQTANGVVDAYAHVLEQYLTFPNQAALQERQAEAILLTLLQEGPRVMAAPESYENRANIMWCATQALNGVIGCGVPQDWATHGIGHELTALHGLDHAQTLAVVFPALLRHQRVQKMEKLIQYGARIWGLEESESSVEQAIDKTEAFFRSLGVKTRLHEYGIDDRDFHSIGRILEERDGRIGERKDIGAAEVEAILRLCA